MFRKLLLLTIGAFLFAGTIFAQNEQGKDMISLSLLNTKGKLLKKISFLAYVGELENAEDIFKSDDSGTLELLAGPDEVITLIINKKMYPIPVNGSTELYIIMKNKSKPQGVRRDDDLMVETINGAISVESNTMASSAVEINALQSYQDLASFIRGRVAGVRVDGNKIYIRGVNSINLDTDPLIIVDGAPAGDFASVNSYLNPMDVESITVDKEGASYGVRGGNGVILITTKGGLKK